MRNSNRLSLKYRGTTTALALFGLVLLAPAFARADDAAPDRGDRLRERGERIEERIDRKLDRKGDAAERRLDRKAKRADKRN